MNLSVTTCWPETKGINLPILKASTIWMNKNFVCYINTHSKKSEFFFLCHQSIYICSSYEETSPKTELSNITLYTTWIHPTLLTRNTDPKFWAHSLLLIRWRYLHARRYFRHYHWDLEDERIPMFLLICSECTSPLEGIRFHPLWNKHNSTNCLLYQTSLGNKGGKHIVDSLTSRITMAAKSHHGPPYGREPWAACGGLTC